MKASPSLIRLGILFALSNMIAMAQTSGDWNAVRGISAGTQVRVTIAARKITGEVVRSGDETLVLASKSGQEMLDRAEIKSVSLKTPSHRRRNTLIGLAVGTGVGVVAGIAAREPDQLQIISDSSVTAISTAMGAVLGTVIGAVIPAGGWREVYRR